MEGKSSKRLDGGVGILSMLGVGLLLSVLAGCQPVSSVPQGVQVYFSPRGGCTEAIVRTLNQATNSIRVQAYSFTSAPIAGALVQAHRRGVKVQIILDDSHRSKQYSGADFFQHSGVTPLIDARHGIAHNKVIIIDERLVVTGSFNFTEAAEEKNAENVLIIADPVLAKKYVVNWELHAQHSEIYVRKT